MYSAELRVTREVSDEQLLGECLRVLFKGLVFAGANETIKNAPADNGILRASSSVQQGNVDYDSSPIPVWAKYGPKILKPPYPGILDEGKAKSSRGKVYSFHYRDGPQAGQPLKGWFTEDVPQALENSPQVKAAVDACAATMEEAWLAAS